MKLELRGNKDFWAGMMFFLIGTVAILVARHYPFGSTLRMGPGYFPVVLSGILIAFGLYIMFRGLRKNEKFQGNWSIRALIVLPLSIVIFGIVMELGGFVPALIALIFVSAASGRDFKFIEILLLALILTVSSVAIFIWGLGLPYPLFQEIW
ncbi:MAG: tripartite tricarboxylate transporter TctB family protein [Thermodesulfobacteriota bacterium]